MEKVYRANIKFLKSKNPLVTQFLDRFSPEKHTTVMRTIIQSYVEAFNNPKVPLVFPAVEALLDKRDEVQTEPVAPEPPIPQKTQVRQRKPADKKVKVIDSVTTSSNKSSTQKSLKKKPAPVVIDFTPLETDNEEISLAVEKDPANLDFQEEEFELKEE